MIPKKVLIFANCHGLIYQNALNKVDTNNMLDIDYIVSYENLSNFEKIQHKFSECDILIIQPVQNYEKFRFENLKPLLKIECQVIRIPFFRFNGYWDQNDSKDLKKISKSSVMFFPCLNSSEDVNDYLERNLDKEEVISRFEKGIEELKNLESQGDVNFVDFFLKYHQQIPMFRDPYHPTDIVYKYLSSQIVEIIRQKNPIIQGLDFIIPKVWGKEYGHFKPIQNMTATILGLEYDLDSFFQISRKDYLRLIINYENSENIEVIDDLNKLKKYLMTNSNDDVVYSYTNNYIVYDKDWQYPAITEEYAYHKIREFSNLGNKNIYIAFPWATLIDKLNKQGEKKSQELLDILKKIKQKIPKNKNVITVCQHILMLKFEDIFAELGVTHVFWSHAVKGQKSFIKYSNISIYPFPLYPVQVVGYTEKYRMEKSILYSFVGAKSNQWYLTQSRTYILELLKEDNRGIVIGRNSWHFNNVVYDHQIHKDADSSKELINSKATNEFKDIVKKSIFSLCPSGTGPNSIRLWESIGLGAIPVILADTFLPPGNQELWEEAVVFCKETKEAIKALPSLLEEMSNDLFLLERKRNALKQLWMIYGPDCFIYDIQKLCLHLEGEDMKKGQYLVGTYLGSLVLKMLETKGEDKLLVTIFMNGLISRFLSSPAFFVKIYNEEEKFRNAVELMINNIDEKKLNYFRKMLWLRKVEL